MKRKKKLSLFWPQKLKLQAKMKIRVRKRLIKLNSKNWHQ